MTISTKEPGAAWHLWLVGALAVIWNGYGCYDYFMTQTGNADHLKAFSPEQIAYWQGMPWWQHTAWAVGVWGGLLGAILLLLRKKLAVIALLLSLAGLSVSIIYTFLLSNGYEVGGSGSVILYGVLFAIALGLWLYAKAMTSRGILR